MMADRDILRPDGTTAPCWWDAAAPETAPEPLPRQDRCADRRLRLLRPSRCGVVGAKWAGTSSDLREQS